MRWTMDMLMKTQVERVGEEIMDSRGATQAQLKRFFASPELREAMLDAYNRMIRRETTPVPRYLREAQTD